MRAARAYGSLDRQTSVMVADKIGLVVLLYDKLTLRLQQARAAFEARDIPARSEAISKSIELIEVGLLSALDDAGGGEVAARLRAHYQLWLAKLLRSNMQASINLLSEVEEEVKTIKLAWDELNFPGGNGRA
jgi:flagellar biosynthetic protein FliS